jgi:hypothetical protein
MRFSLRSIKDDAIRTAREILKVVGRILGLILLLVFLIGLLQIVVKTHWSLGIPYVAILGVVVFFGIRQYQQGKIDTWQGIGSLCSILLMSVSIFSFISLVLNRFGRAQYEGFDGRFVNNIIYVLGQFFGFYVWELFECIPALRINNALGLSEPPLRQSGPVAGVLLLVFRVLIIFIVLDVFRKWWGTRKKSKILEPIEHWFITGSMVAAHAFRIGRGKQ